MEVIVTKEEIVKTEALEARYKRYKSILKDLTIIHAPFRPQTQSKPSFRPSPRTAPEKTYPWRLRPPPRRWDSHNHPSPPERGPSDDPRYSPQNPS